MAVNNNTLQGKTFLGLELGSTRIKAVLADESFSPAAQGSHTWENRLENNIWTYSLDDIHKGVQSCFSSLAEDHFRKYGKPLTEVSAMGISAMMHGYMAFDKNGRLLVPFRTWRNTSPKQASEELSQLLGFNIPRRWSIAHLYQAILDGEEHIRNIDHITTLAGYVNFLLTGDRDVGMGDASGIFPIAGKSYNKKYLELVQKKFEEHGFDKKIEDILPPVKSAGETGAYLTGKGAAFLDTTGSLKAGIPVCPPEGDAGTGMTAANAVRAGTGNVSAGTSVFSMLVLEKPLKGMYPEIDVVTTPDGAPTAMVHCNNCCAELDAWVNMFGEFAALSGNNKDISEIYEILYKNAMKGGTDCGGITAYNFLSGEPVAGVEKGSPAYFRQPDSIVTLANFFRAQLYSAFGALKMGMDILFEKEKVTARQFTGHGGIFKVKGAAQQILADGLVTPVSVMSTAGEGGAWGMALLAAYMVCGNGESLADWLDSKVFGSMEKYTVTPDSRGAAGFGKFMERYRSGLKAYDI